MSVSNINNLYLNMAQISSTFRELYNAIVGINNYYASMRLEAKQTLIDSKVYWEQTALAESEKVLNWSSEKRAKAAEMINGLESLETQLYAIDGSYAKRRDREFSSQEHVYSTYDSSVDLFAKLTELHDEAVEIARDCSLTVTFQPIQELSMLFSPKRKHKYERLYHLIVETKYLKQLLYSKLEDRDNKQSFEWWNKKNEGIEKASSETSQLIKAIDAKEKETIEKSFNNYHAQIESIVSTEDISILKELESTLGKSNQLPNECCEPVLIGNLSIDLSEVLAFQESVDYVNKNYRNCIVGTKMVLPAIYDLGSNFDFCFDGHGNNDATIVAINSIMYSLMINQPASRQTFILSDPEGRAKGFSTYLDFAKSFPDIFGDKILTTKDQIKSSLRELSGFVDEIGQTKLVGYRDIFDYNNKVPDKQEPLKCLCLLNFPKYFDTDMFEDLLNVIKNGKLYGIQVLLGFDENEIDKRNLNNHINYISEILTACIHLEYSNGKWFYPNGVAIELNESPSARELDSFIKAFSVQYKDIKDTTLPIRSILNNEWFESSAEKRLEIPIGKNEDGAIQSLVFGEGTSHHALVIGSLGSGKSTLLHTIIISSILNYSPEELNLYLMDYKSGTEFKIYAEHKIPHIKLLALDAMQEFGQSILDELWVEMNRRSALFNELVQQGMDVKDITDYRKMTGKNLPRILVIADEFQMMVSEEHNRKIANYCGGRLADFISLSRVFGIHFILSTQTLSRLNSGFAIRKSTLNEMYVRIGLKCIENECSLLFGEYNAKKAFGKMGTEIGTAVYVGDYSQDTPVGFKVAYCDSDTITQLLESVDAYYASLSTEKQTKVFIGSSVPKLTDSVEFNEKCSTDSKTLPVYLGEPIKIDDPVSIKLNRTKRNNLLIVGNNSDMTDDLIALYMTGVVRVPAIANNQINVYLFDGLTIIGEMNSENVRAVLTRYSNRIKSAEDNYDAVKMVDELYGEFINRKKNRQTFEVNAGNTIVVVLNNLQWIDSIKLMLDNRSVSEYIQDDTVPNNESYSNDVSTLLSRMDLMLEEMQESTSKDTSSIPYGKKIMELIENGYTCGIHFVMSVPDYISIKEYMYNVAPKFSNRILFSMSNDDASRLVNDAKTEQLRDNIVVFHDGINPSYQIKPYSGIMEYIYR